MLAKGEVEYDGPASEAITRYHQSLALEESPEEVGAGLREWGSGEVRVEGVSLMGADGEPRVHFVSGEPVTIVLQLVGERPVAAPVLSLEVRDGDGSLLGADQQNVGELGWDGAPGERELRFLLEKLPLGEGEFQVSVALTDTAGTRQYHRVDGAVHFAVESSDHARGAVLLDGEWSLVDAANRVETG
jgi:lipopolysaccharide transport system ATP-binding protein